MNELPFSILKEDLEASKAENEGQTSFSPTKCPFLFAFKRQFPEKRFGFVGINEVYKTLGVPIAQIKKGFGLTAFNQLRDQGIEHHTTIIFNS